MKLRNKKIDLHLACGPNIVDGWQNIDILDLPGIIHHDLTKPLPYKTNSVNRIFHEHFIEHLNKQEGYGFLEESFRVLQPKGVMKMGWPDLGKLIKAYNSKDKKFESYIMPFIEPRSLFKDWDEIFSDCLFDWDHRYAYTQQHMIKILERIGFTSVKVVKYKESRANIKIDVRNDPATTYIEAEKPQQ